MPVFTTPENTIVRFWHKVNKTDTCWIWTGTKFKDGYGKFSIRDIDHRAHRYVYETEVGPIPRGLYVLHKCDNRSCVNPTHLFVGTHQNNMDDMKAKGRNFINSKLTVEQVLQIRELSKSKKQTELTQMFNISRSAISAIITNRSWRNAA